MACHGHNGEMRGAGAFSKGPMPPVLTGCDLLKSTPRPINLHPKSSLRSTLPMCPKWVYPFFPSYRQQSGEGGVLKIEFADSFAWTWRSQNFIAPPYRNAESDQGKYATAQLSRVASGSRFFGGTEAGQRAVRLAKIFATNARCIPRCALPRG